MRSTDPITPKVKAFLLSTRTSASSQKPDKKKAVPQLQPTELTLAPTVTIHQSEQTDHTSTLEEMCELARDHLFADEIASILDLHFMDVLDSSRTHGFYVWEGAKEQEQTLAIIAHASHGASVDEIFYDTGIPRASIRYLSKYLVSRKGEGYEKVAHLVSESVSKSTDESAEQLMKCDTALPEPLTKDELMFETTVPHNLEVGRCVSVLSIAHESNPALEGYQSKWAIVTSILDHVVNLHFEDGHTVLARMSEVRVLKGDDEWSIGDEVMFQYDGDLVTGIIENGPLNFRGEARYLINMDGVHDTVSPRDFIQ